MLLRALTLHQGEQEEKRRHNPRQSAAARCHGAWGWWCCLPSRHTSPQFGVNPEDIRELRKQVPSCSRRPGTLTVL